MLHERYNSLTRFDTVSRFNRPNTTVVSSGLVLKTLNSTLHEKHNYNIKHTLMETWWKHSQIKSQYDFFMIVRQTSAIEISAVYDIRKMVGV